MMYAKLPHLRQAILALAIALVNFASATSDAETALVELSRQVTEPDRETLEDSLVNGKTLLRQKDTGCPSHLSSVLFSTCQTLQLETSKHRSPQCPNAHPCRRT
jgi:hypothetical protein